VGNADARLLFMPFYVKVCSYANKNFWTFITWPSPNKIKNIIIELLISERRNCIASIVSAAHEYDSINNRGISGQLANKAITN